MPCSLSDWFFTSIFFKEDLVISEQCIFVVAISFLFVGFGEKLGRRKQDSCGRRMKGFGDFT